MKRIRTPLWLLAACLFVVWAIFGHKYQFAYNKGGSMEPAYSNGDWIIVEKRNHLRKSWRPDRYDVVLINDPESADNLCKRVIGLSGDTIEIKEGIILLNDEKLKDPFGRGTVQLVDEKQIAVPKGFVWIIGDERECSWYGILSIKNIKGLIIL